MIRIIHTGQALVDVVLEVPGLPRQGQNVMAAAATEYAGGAVNILLAAARQGARAVHAGAHGTGPHGDLIRQSLAAEGVVLSAPQVEGQDTGICMVLVEPTGERSFVTTLGAERHLSVEMLVASNPGPRDLVCVTGYSLAVPQTRDPLLDWLKTLDEDVTVVLDPGAVFAGLEPEVRDTMIAQVDVWTSNADEAMQFCGVRGMQDAARRITELLPRGTVSVVRDGPEGCAIALDHTVVLVPGFPQDAVDTNGAGDTHTGVLLAMHAEGLSWVDAARRANAAAAIKVTRKGPSAAPSRAEVDAFLAARW